MRALVFDAYGTIFDVASIVSVCGTVTPTPEPFTALWRAKQLEYAFLRTIMHRYQDFWRITEDALHYTLKRHDVTVTAEQERLLLEAWLHLQPFPEVPDTLQRLQTFPRLILSNGSPAMLAQLLVNTKLQDEFDAVLSVDAVRCYKPAPQVYELAVRQLGCTPREIIFLSANGFDVAGAKAFGFTVCQVNRTGAPLDELGVMPDATLNTLAELPDVLTKLP